MCGKQRDRLKTWSQKLAWKILADLTRKMDRGR